jgi:serine/threonine-protein kinase HipA
MGTLVWHDGRAWFEFSPDLLDLGVNPSPLLLEKTTKPQPAPLAPFGGLQAVFHDSLPDGWGMFVLDRYLQQCGIHASQITPLMRLAFIGDRGMGALSYEPSHPQAPHVNSHEAIDLVEVRTAIENLYRKSEAFLGQCLAANGTPVAGGQPKLLIGYDGKQLIEGAGTLPRRFSHWLIKFCSIESLATRWDGTIEYVYSLMAKKAGIHMTGARLIPDDRGVCHYLTRRFDRTSRGHRIFVQRASSLLNEDCRSSTLEYLDLFKLSDFLTHNYANKLFLFRQMVFNIMLGNRDDHLGNFAFMLSDCGEWSCTPAFDVSWNTGMGKKHAMGVNGRTTALSRSDVLEVAKRASISRRDALSTIEQVSDAIGHATPLLQEHEVPKEAVREIARYIEKKKTTFDSGS